MCFGRSVGAGETWVAGQLRLAEHRAEPLKQVLGRSGEDDPSPVERLIGTAWPACVLEVPALTHDTLPTIEGRCVFHDAEGRLVEGRVDPLPLASRVAMAQSGQDPECREQSGHVVGIHRRRPCGRPVRMPVHVPRPAKGRADGSIPGPLIEWPRLAEGGDPRHHQPRVDRVEHLPAEPPPLEDPGAEVLEDDVARGHEATGDFLTLGSVKVERDELFVPIVGGKPVVTPVLGGTETPQVVTAARHLGLDHLGAELGHEHTAEGTGHHLGQLEDAYSLKRKTCGRHRSGV